MSSRGTEAGLAPAANDDIDVVSVVLEAILSSIAASKQNCLAAYSGATILRPYSTPKNEGGAAMQ